MTHDSLEAEVVARMFSYAVERAMNADRVSDASFEGAVSRNRRRHEAVVQHMLDFVLRANGELSRFVEVFGLDARFGPALYTEWRDPDSGWRFDHCIDDRQDAWNWNSICIIEDKVEASLGPGQLENYCSYLSKSSGKKLLLVLHPERRPLANWLEHSSRLASSWPLVDVRFMSWRGFADRMITDRTPSSAVSLYRALAEFAETVGAGYVPLPSGVEALLDANVSVEVRDALMTAQNVANRLRGSAGTGRLGFSFNRSSDVPWLQSGLTAGGVGLQVDLVDDLGRLQIGTIDHVIDAKIGGFPNGILDEAAEFRVKKLERLARRVRSGASSLPEELTGPGCGADLTDRAQDVFAIVGAVFHAKALLNSHRTGIAGHVEGFSEGERHERIGAKFTGVYGSGRQVGYLFLGPPPGCKWERCSLWLRVGGNEHEISPVLGESGSDYAHRVWAQVRLAFGVPKLM